MSATTTAIIEAKRDADLRERAIAIAASLGIENPQYFIESKAWELATAPVNGSGDTVASVYEYIDGQDDAKRKDLERQLAELPKPGANLSGVTDDHLTYAVNKLKESSTQATAAVAGA